MKGSKRKRNAVFGGLICLSVAFLAIPTHHLFDAPYSSVVYSREDRLLGAHIAADGQWRFPPSDSLPAFYKQAVLTFEDRHFYHHPGIDPVALVRAAVANMKAGRIVQGGSTITMQVVRMGLGNQPRTIWQKIKEMVIALRMELAYSKEEIFSLYAAHAPFGGNVVGLEAASWRYFSRPPQQLSVAEYALLAVLPNAPSALRPGKNPDELLAKRNRLLLRLTEEGKLSIQDYDLAILEALPTHPNPLPNQAMHLAQYAFQGQEGHVVHTTLNHAVQEHTRALLDRYYKKMKVNGVHNAAILVADVRTGEVLAYHGNTNCGLEHGHFVDVVQAARSSGSILKPFLYCAMQQNGQLLPNQLVPDIPTFLSGFKPENYARSYEGAVPASQALARSLNVPAVRELKAFGVKPFRAELLRLGFKTVNRSAENYGLSLILGGAEVTLWDVCSAYLTLAQSVHQGSDQAFVKYQLHADRYKKLVNETSVDPGSAYLTLEALKSSSHSHGDQGLHAFVNNRIAWKTGTSFGYRDAWAVGIDANYVVGVWVGNADGEGRPGVIGAQAAAPIMFEVFSSLPDRYQWFNPPYNYLREIETCAQSGFIALPSCIKTVQIWAAFGSVNGSICNFHRTIRLSKDGTERFAEHCGGENSTAQTWFVLPAAWAHYYAKANPHYKPIPPLAKGCKSSSKDAMQLIYPARFQKVYSARQMDGRPGPIVFKLAHRDHRKRVYWHANGHYLGETKELHDLPVELDPGNYLLHLVDEDGNELNQRIEIL